MTPTDLATALLGPNYPPDAVGVIEAAFAGVRREPMEVAIDVAAARVAELEKQNADLKMEVIAFCGPWAVQYARDHELPPGSLHSVHYDILARCGARMDDFTRHEGE